MTYEDGLLSQEFDDFAREVERRLPSELAIFSEINRFAVSLQSRIEVPSDDLPKLMTALLFIRTLANVQGAALLIRRGLGTQTQIILRAAMESLFLLRAIASDPNLARSYERSDAVRRKKLHGKSRQWASCGGSVPAAAISAELLKEIEEEIAADQAKEFKVEDMARKAGLHEWYLMVYSVFSGAVHTVPRDLEDHLIIDNGRLVAISSAPRLEGLRELLLTASEMLLIAAGALEDVFKIGAGDLREELSSRLRSTAQEGTETTDLPR